MKNKKRRKEFVDRAVQGALVRRLLVHWLAFALSGVALGVIFQGLSDPFRPLPEHLGMFFRTNFCFILAMVCMTPVFIVDTIKLSNRFAGPIYRLRCSMRELNSGERPRPLKFRPKDFWHDLADEFNTIAARQHEDADSTDREKEPALTA